MHASSGAGSISPNELVSKLLRPDFLNKLHAVAANARRLADAQPRPQASSAAPSPPQAPQEPPREPPREQPKQRRPELWVTEMGGAYNSGCPGVTDAFPSIFWFADALAALALHGTQVVCRQTLVGGSYGLVALGTARVTSRSGTNGSSSSGGGVGGGGGGGVGGGSGGSGRRGLRPDFWVALLWRRLVGLRVLRADVHAHEAAPYENSNSVPPLLPLRVYAFCSRQKTPSGGVVLSGGVILLLINLGAHAAEADVSTLLTRATNGSVAAQDDATLGFDGGARALAPKTPRTTPRHEWHLNASSFYATEAVLNGMPLHSTDSEVPELPPPLVIDEGTVVHVSPHSASFVEFLSAHWPECQ